MKHYLVRNAMVYNPLHKNHYSILDIGEMKLRESLAYAGDPGEVLAIIDGNDVIPKPFNGYVTKESVLKLIEETVKVESLRNKLIERIGELK